MKLLVRQEKAIPTALSDKVRVVVQGFVPDNGTSPATSKTISLVQTSIEEVISLIKTHCGQED